MNTVEMFQEVDRRVADGIMEHLLPKAKQYHTTRGWRSCDCSFCATKRRATYDIGLCKIDTNYQSDFDYRTMFSIFEHDYDYKQIREFRREALRTYYRNKLKGLYNE